MKFSQPQWEILDSVKPLNLFLSGKGSGKSHLAGVISANLISEFPDCIGFIGANTYEQVNTSTLTRVFSVWKELGWTEYSEQNKKGCYVVNKQPPKAFKESKEKFISYNNIISFANGVVVYIASLENAKAHEGKNFAWAILDETKDSREDDVKDTILTRLRQKGIVFKGKDINPLYILTSPAKVEWINKWFHLDKYIDEINAHIYSETDFFKLETDLVKVVISSTYHNKHNLPENYFNVLRESNSEEKYSTIVYANPFGRAGGEYYGSFERKKHVGLTVYNPELPLHISFDFNLNPYNPCGIYQLEIKGNKKYVRMIDEFALRSPRNSVEHVCEAVIDKYINHKSGFYLYGDATGRSGSISNKEQKSYWRIIEDKFYRHTVAQSYRVPKSNMPNALRRDAMNLIFEGKKDIELLIGEQCEYMIKDLMYCKEDKEGGKDKKTVTDENGHPYQPYGHFGDLLEYFICEAFKKELFL